ncbi:MAG: hypothetical protein JEZ11_26085 [Desulfobacterales bacterium]|nr:hypothetical protein [Desulfobacterales bacterium]
MVRTQIQLDETQASWLKSTAREKGVSISQLIRESIDLYCRIEQRIPEERKRAAIEAVGRFKSDRSDVSLNHDRYLAEAYASDGPS